MAHKIREIKRQITYGGSGSRYISAQRSDETIDIWTSRTGSPEMTIDQWERFAAKLQQFCRDARNCS